MSAGPVMEIFFNFTLLLQGSNSLAMMSWYSLMPQMTPVGSDTLQHRMWCMLIAWTAVPARFRTVTCLQYVVYSSGVNAPVTRYFRTVKSLVNTLYIAWTGSSSPKKSLRLR